MHVARVYTVSVGKDKSSAAGLEVSDVGTHSLAAAAAARGFVRVWQIEDRRMRAASDMPRTVGAIVKTEGRDGGARGDLDRVLLRAFFLRTGRLVGGISAGEAQGWRGALFPTGDCRLRFLLRPSGKTAHGAAIPAEIGEIGLCMSIPPSSDKRTGLLRGED